MSSQLKQPISNEKGETREVIQPEKESLNDLIKQFPVIDDVIKSLESCKGYAPQAQESCIEAGKRVRIAAIARTILGITPEQFMKILQEPTPSDRERVYTTTVTQTGRARIEVNKTYVPLDVAFVYVFLQNPKTLESGSSEFIKRVSRDEFVKNWSEYVKIAKGKQMKLVVRASTADEKKWLQTEIKWNDKQLIQTTFRDPSNGK